MLGREGGNHALFPLSAPLISENGAQQLPDIELALSLNRNWGASI